MEERSIAESIFNVTQPESDAERIVDYIHFREYEKERRRLKDKGKRGLVYAESNLGVRMDDHIVTRIIAGILWPRGYNQGRYPLNDAEENQDKIARNMTASLIAEIRINKRFAYLGIITDLLHKDANTGDFENVIFAGRTEKKKNGSEKLVDLKKDDPRKIWIERRDKRRKALDARTQQTLDNFLRSEADIISLEQQERLFRRRRRAGPGGL
jgi:hypothetical protein